MWVNQFHKPLYWVYDGYMMAHIEDHIEEYGYSNHFEFTAVIALTIAIMSVKLYAIRTILQTTIFFWLRIQTNLVG